MNDFFIPITTATTTASVPYWIPTSYTTVTTPSLGGGFIVYPPLESHMSKGWNGEIYYNPSPKLRTLMDALRLI